MIYFENKIRDHGIDSVNEIVSSFSAFFSSVKISTSSSSCSTSSISVSILSKFLSCWNFSWEITIVVTGSSLRIFLTARPTNYNKNLVHCITNYVPFTKIPKNRKTFKKNGDSLLFIFFSIKNINNGKELFK